MLIRAGRADLIGAVTALREAAGGLPHPALEAAALEHASFLENLAEEWDVLTRQVLLVIREPAHGSCPVSARALRAGHICGRWSCPQWTPSGVSVSVVTMVVRRISSRVFVGRRMELAALDAVLARAGNGDGSAAADPDPE